MNSLSRELRSLFDSRFEGMSAAALPSVVTLSDEAGLHSKSGVADVADCIRAALSLAIDREREAATNPSRRSGELIGAQAFLFLDGGPDEAEREAIRRANHAGEYFGRESQTMRLSWARWQQVRALAVGGTADQKAPTARSGRSRREEYASALTRAVSAAAQEPADWQAMVRDQMPLTVQGPLRGAALEVHTASARYSSDLAIDEAMRVERTIESEIVEGLVG